MALTAPIVTEPTTAIRDWLRGLSLTVAGRVWAGKLPEGPTLPAVVFYRISGTVNEIFDVGFYQLDCLAETPVAAASLAGEIQTALVGATTPASLAAVTEGELVLLGWFDVNGRPDFDPDPKFCRYIVTAQATTITQPS